MCCEHVPLLAAFTPVPQDHVSSALLVIIIVFVVSIVLAVLLSYYTYRVLRRTRNPAFRIKLPQLQRLRPSKGRRITQLVLPLTRPSQASSNKGFLRRYLGLISCYQRGHKQEIRPSPTNEQTSEPTTRANLATAPSQRSASVRVGDLTRFLQHSGILNETSQIDANPATMNKTPEWSELGISDFNIEESKYNLSPPEPAGTDILMPPGLNLPVLPLTLEGRGCDFQEVIDVLPNRTNSPEPQSSQGEIQPSAAISQTSSQRPALGDITNTSTFAPSIKSTSSIKKRSSRRMPPTLLLNGEPFADEGRNLQAAQPEEFELDLNLLSPKWVAQDATLSVHIFIENAVQWVDSRISFPADMPFEDLATHIQSEIGWAIELWTLSPNGEDYLPIISQEEFLFLVVNPTRNGIRVRVDAHMAFD